MKLKTITTAAVFLAIILLLSITRLGIIPIPPANITIYHVVVIAGTLLLGLKYGMIFGAAFGVTSAVWAFSAPSALMMPLLGVSPVYPIIISILPRLLIPLFTYLKYKACIKIGFSERLSIGAAAVAGTLTNTIFYLGLMYIFYLTTGIEHGAVLTMIATTAALNGTLEVAVCVLITVFLVPPLKGKIGGAI